MLKARILTALAMGIVMLGVLFGLPRELAALLLAALVLAGAWEWSGFAGLPQVAGRLGYVLAVAALLAAGWWLTSDPASLRAMLYAVLGWWLVALGWILLAPLRGGVRAAALAGLVILPTAGVALCRLLLDVPAGRLHVAFIIVLVAAADVGAFFAGRAFGRLKLAPRVSPGKTWEGAIGGFVLALAVAAVGGRWLGYDGWAFVVLCGAVAIVSVVGDLTESLFKRHAGLKDSGRLLPGHGGVLDRIDSLSAAVPVYLLGLLWLGDPT